MKLICLEEHVLDPTTAQASMPAALATAPYLPGWGKTVRDGQNPDRSRPQVIANTDSTRKGMDWDAERLADMDAAGITMQVLSLGGFPQYAPPAEQPALSQAVNARLAATVAAQTGLKQIEAGVLKVDDVYPQFEELLMGASDRIKATLDAVDEVDHLTNDLLIGIARGLEKQAWMLRSASRA